MVLNDEMKKVLLAVPLQVSPEITAIRRKAIRELQAMGLVYLTYPTRLSALMQVPTVQLSSAGELVVPPTVEGK